MSDRFKRKTPGAESDDAAPVDGNESPGTTPSPRGQNGVKHAGVRTRKPTPRQRRKPFVL